MILSGIHNLPLFFVTALAFVLFPGPSTLYILGRSVSQGPRAGVLSVLGISTGSGGHVLAVAFGLSVLLTTSQAVFSVFKVAGAAYLIYLGIQALRRPPMGAALPTDVPRARERTIYVQGFLTQLLNPKASLFFLALLPQFVEPAAAHSPLPFLFLGLCMIAMDGAWFTSVALGGGWVASLLRRSARFGVVTKWASGVLYIGLGLNLLRLRARFAS